jgi:Ca2+-binding EF-hand superfamily protein
LKVGGVMMFDDWLWNMNQPIAQRPKVAIDAFVEAFSPFIQVIEQRNSQSFFLEKVLDSRESAADLWYVDAFYGEHKQRVSSITDRLLRNERIPGDALNRWFVIIDRDHDGSITREEYASSREGENVTPATDFDAMLIRPVDADRDGRLGAAEALAGYGENMDIAALKDWLKALDRNRDGRVTSKEYVRIRGGGGQVMFDLLLAQADADGDGELTSQELISTFGKSSSR